MSKDELTRQRRKKAYAKFARTESPAPVSDDDYSELAQRYAYLVHRWARRYAGTSMAVIDWDDLVSVGIMGLIQAKQRFDPSSGKPFEVYAEFRIKGAILDELRRVDPFSQPLRRKVRRLTRAMEELTNELGREPTDNELSKCLGLTIEDVRRLLQQVQHLRQTSVEEIDRHSLSRDLAISGWSRTDLKVALSQAIKRLDKRNQTILSLYYFQGLSMAEIGKVIGVTEARVSQLHSGAVKDLRFALTGSTKRP